MNPVQKWLYPELASIADQRDLEFKIRELINRAGMAPKREALARSAIAFAVLVAAYFTLLWTLPRLHFIPPSIAQAAPGVFALSVGPLSLMIVNRRVQRKAIRRAMVRCGIPICVPCGYDLSKTDPSDPCPECGSAYPELGDPATALRLDPKEPTP